MQTAQKFIAGTKRKRSESDLTAGSAIKKKKQTPVATKSYVKRLIKSKQELKFKDVQFSTISISSGGSVDKLTTIAQGDTDSTRDGDELMPTSLECKLQLIKADDTNIVRHIIFRWKPADNASSPSISSILQYGTPTSPIYHDARDDFQVLYDKLYNFDSTHPTLAVNFRLPFAKQMIRYVSGSLYGTNNIYSLLVSDSAAINHPTANGYYRTNFTDS